MRRFRPAAVDAAHQFGFAGQRRLPRAYHVGAEVGIGAPGLQGQRLGGVILGVDRGKRLQPLLDVLRVPRQQDRLWLVPEPTIIFSPAMSSALSILLSGLLLLT